MLDLETIIDTEQMSFLSATEDVESFSSLDVSGFLYSAMTFHIKAATIYILILTVATRM